MKKNILNNRRFKHGTLATVMTIGLVAAVVLVNIIFSMLMERLPSQVDLTDNKIFEISDESIDYVKALDKDVKITILATEAEFAGSNEYYNQANEVINKYKQYSDRITIEYVDLYANPDIVNKYPNESLYKGYVLVECGDRYQVLTPYDLFNTEQQQSSSSSTGYTTVIASSNAEQAMTSAVMFVTDANPITVTVLTGFGETDISDFTDMLNKNGYLITETNLMTEEIDLDASVAILAAPTRDLDEASLKKLDEFLDNNGRLGKNLLYFTGAEQPLLPKLGEFLEEWGIAVNDGYLAETDSNYIYYSPLMMMQEYDADAYTEDLNTSLPLLVSYARSFEQLFDAQGGRTTEILFKTHSSAVLIPSDAPEDFTLEDGEKDVYYTGIRGFRTVYEGTTALISGVAAFGSVDMISSSYLSFSAIGNAEYMLNVVNTLTNKAEGIKIVSKTLGTESLGISASSANTIGMIFQIALPVIVILAGGFVWIRRRNR